MLQLIADGQVLHRGQDPHLALLLGRLDLISAADFDNLVVTTNVGQHQANLV